MATRRRRSPSKSSATKGKGRLKKGYRYAKGGRIVKAKSKR
ncbi:hypothetical protein [uncultured Hydrogenophaga sp.]|nr:hypothetical protein [uncultured Hydrogenophaga sp.]